MGGYRQRSQFPCLYCGLTVQRKRVIDHLRAARTGELSECQRRQATAAERIANEDRRTASGTLQGASVSHD